MRNARSGLKRRPCLNTRACVCVCGGGSWFNDCAHAFLVSEVHRRRRTGSELAPLASAREVLLSCFVHLLVEFEFLELLFCLQEGFDLALQYNFVVVSLGLVVEFHFEIRFEGRFARLVLVSQRAVALLREELGLLSYISVELLQLGIVLDLHLLLDVEDRVLLVRQQKFADASVVLVEEVVDGEAQQGLRHFREEILLQQVDLVFAVNFEFVDEGDAVVDLRF